MKNLILFIAILFSLNGMAQDEIMIPIEAPVVSIENCTIMNTATKDTVEVQYEGRVAYIFIFPNIEYEIWINKKKNFFISTSNWDVMDERDLCIRGLDDFWFYRGTLILDYSD